MSSFGKNGTPKSEANAPHKERRPLNPTIKWLIIGLLCVAAVVLIGVLSSGGEDEGGLSDVKAYINYHANGGEFDDHKSDKTLGFKANSYPLNIAHRTEGVSKGSANLSERTGYIFQGWYLPVRDANGELVYEDEAKTIVKLGEKFDFTKRLEDDAQIDLYAKWLKAEYVSVLLSGTGLTDADGKTYQVGDEIRELYFENNKVEQYGGSRLLSLERGKYTFVEYFYDEACTQVVSWPIQKTEGETKYTIYAKFIEGDWEIVANKADAVSMFSGLSIKKQYYVISDIDMGGATVGTSSSVSATVVGNGYTISNFTVEKKNVDNNGTSLLGAVKAGAKIENLKLDNVKLSVSLRPNVAPDIYFLFTEIDAKAQISGLQVTGTMIIDRPTGVTINNIQPNLHDKWIIGGEQSILENGGITVTVTCTIGEETYSYPLTQG